MERLRFKECQKCDKWNGTITHCMDICMKPFYALEEFNRYKDLEEQGLLKTVVRGEWKSELGLFFPVYRCSECNCATALGQTNFCPYCGADMRKKEMEGES